MATTQLQLRRGTAAQNDTFSGAEGEITIDLTNKCLRLHDGNPNVSGGTIIPKKSDVVSATGNVTQDVTGVKTFTSAIKSTVHSTTIPNGVLNASCAQANDRYSDLIGLYDTSNDCRCCTIRAYNTPLKHSMLLGANNFSNSAPTGMEIAYDANGNLTITASANPGNYTTYATSDAGYSKIATAGWVNNSGSGVNNVVHKDGTETISGQKTFSAKIYANGGVQGTASSALWADLAEQYVPDEKYSIGTLIKFGGEKDITIADTECNGIISEQPGFLLDCGLEDSLPVALTGKTRVRVIGKVNKFDKLVLSKTPGVAKVKESEDEKVIGIALASSEEKEEKLVMSVVKIEF